MKTQHISLIIIVWDSLFSDYRVWNMIWPKANKRWFKKPSKWHLELWTCVMVTRIHKIFVKEKCEAQDRTPTKKTDTIDSECLSAKCQQQKFFGTVHGVGVCLFPLHTIQVKKNYDYFPCALLVCNRYEFIINFVKWITLMIALLKCVLTCDHCISRYIQQNEAWRGEAWCVCAYHIMYFAHHLRRSDSDYVSSLLSASTNWLTHECDWYGLQTISCIKCSLALARPFGFQVNDAVWRVAIAYTTNGEKNAFAEKTRKKKTPKRSNGHSAACNILMWCYMYF